MRSCIGRPFAWQEALLAMAMLFQNFNFQMADPTYQLDISETLTIKPKGFFMYASLRHGMGPGALERQLGGYSTLEPETNGRSQKNSPDKTTGEESSTSLSIFYGSNSGTCEALAQRLARSAASYGFVVSTLGPLDAGRENLPTCRPVVLITSSYEGRPPDNAAQFCAWVETLRSAELQNVEFAVFGCGHHDWAQTFHRIPKLLDSTLVQRGATRVVPMGLTDVAESDIFNDFETWAEDQLWPALVTRYQATNNTTNKLSSNLSVEVSMPRSAYLRQDVREARVLETKILTSDTGPRKNHIEIQLPTGMTYRAGDYLAILPMNPPQNVERVFRRLRLARDAQLTISGDDKIPLPFGQHVSAYDVFCSYVELGQPATRRDLRTLAENASDKSEAKQLGDIANADNMKQRCSVLDILEEFPSIQLSVGALLSLLPPLRIRQ